MRAANGCRPDAGKSSCAVVPTRRPGMFASGTSASTQTRDRSAIVSSVVDGSTDVPTVIPRFTTTPLRGACRVEGGDPSRRLDVRFSVGELRVRVADQYGLLLPDQVERIALHELGHALGMRGHSPIPADLMYPVVRDRLPRGELGTEDVNSFLSLYSLPKKVIVIPNKMVNIVI